MGVILGRLLPYLIAAAAAAACGFFIGQMAGRDASHKLGNNFVRAYFFDAQECRIDKAALVSQVGQERQRSREIIERIQQIEKLSGAAKARLMADLEATRKELAVQEAESSRKLAMLQQEMSEDAENWKRGVIPPDITCGVFDGSGCASVRAAATGTGGDGDMAVREPAARTVDADAMP